VLYFAFLAGEEAGVRLLMNSVADVNMGGYKEKTHNLPVLRLAAERQEETVVKLLIDSKTDVEKNEREGMTLLHISSVRQYDNDTITN
jgi:hypothetical protein